MINKDKAMKIDFFKWLKRKAKKSPSSHTKMASAKQEPFVFITAKGKKFHYDRFCPYLTNANEIKMQLSKARKAGYTECDKCRQRYLQDEEY